MVEIINSLEESELLLDPIELADCEIKDDVILEKEKFLSINAKDSVKKKYMGHPALSYRWNKNDPYYKKEFDVPIHTLPKNAMEIGRNYIKKESLSRLSRLDPYVKKIFDKLPNREESSFYKKIYNSLFVKNNPDYRYPKIEDIPPIIFDMYNKVLSNPGPAIDLIEKNKNSKKEIGIYDAIMSIPSEYITPKDMLLNVNSIIRFYSKYSDFFS